MEDGIYTEHNKVLPVPNNSKQPKKELLFLLEEKKNTVILHVHVSQN